MLVDRFLEDATEVDVDALRDATGEVVIGGVMEHVEEAGVHSGDSACSLPPHSLDARTIAVLEDYTRRLATALDVRGLINVQYAVKQGQVFVIEANPRASRTVPFVAKATGVPLVKVAARIMVGATLAELRAEGLLREPVSTGHIAVKEAVLPFDRFPDVDSVLGPEMRSTGEVMGIDRTFGLAFGKSQVAAGDRLPESGMVFLSLADRDKAAGVRAASQFVALGFEIAATAGTADHLESHGVAVAQRVATWSGLHREGVLRFRAPSPPSGAATLTVGGLVQPATFTWTRTSSNWSFRPACRASASITRFNDRSIPSSSTASTPPARRSRIPASSTWARRSATAPASRSVRASAGFRASNRNRSCCTKRGRGGSAPTSSTDG